MSALTSALPADARTALADPLAKVLSNQSGGLLSFGIITALWSGSAAVSTFIKALNRAYDVEETRPFWRRKGVQRSSSRSSLASSPTAAFIIIVFGGKTRRRDRQAHRRGASSSLSSGISPVGR